MIEITRLNVEHMHQIVLFDKTCFPTDFWKEEDWKDLLEDPRAIYYALLDGEKIVGDVFVYNWKGEKDYIKIMNIAVHADYRNHGLAHMLLNYVTAEMKKIGMHRFCGETRASNHAMQRVFENCGYILNVVEEDYYDNPNESAYKLNMSCKYNRSVFGEFPFITQDGRTSTHLWVYRAGIPCLSLWERWPSAARTDMAKL